MRVATFNIEGASHTGSWQSRAKKSAHMVLSRHVDVIGFQEMQTPQRDYFKHHLHGYDNYPTGQSDAGHRIENSIFWNTSEYQLIGSGIQKAPRLEYFCGQDLDAPWVELQDKQTGQKFFVLNTHDPAYAPGPNNCSTAGGTGSPAYGRYIDAKRHVAFMRSLPKNVPVVYTGDFNGGYTKEPNGNATAYQDKNKYLGYCVMVGSGVVRDAYDVYKNRSYQCPNPKPAADVTYGGGDGIDHVYLTPGIQVDGWVRTAVGEHRDGSDHPMQAFDISIPASFR